METINKLKKLYVNTNYTPNRWENDLGVTYALFSERDNNSINIENEETVEAIAENFDEFNTLLEVLPETPHFVVYDNAWIFRSLSWYKYDTVIVIVPTECKYELTVSCELMVRDHESYSVTYRDVELEDLTQTIVKLRGQSIRFAKQNSKEFEDIFGKPESDF
jgi:hypothetical protein